MENQETKKREPWIGKEDGKFHKLDAWFLKTLHPHVRFRYKQALKKFNEEEGVKRVATLVGMKPLVDILKRETATLKTQYVEKVQNWAGTYFKILEGRKKWNEEAWCKFFGLIPEMANPGTSSQFLSFPRGFHNTEDAKRYHNMKNDIRRVVGMGLEKYLEEEKLKAEYHYEASIEKLAFRIQEKELDQSKLKVKTSHIGVNIDTVLTDGTKTVRAFTIIAEGEIIRPHYRYLIK